MFFFPHNTSLQLSLQKKSVVNIKKNNIDLIILEKNPIFFYYKQPHTYSQKKRREIEQKKWQVQVEPWFK